MGNSNNNFIYQECSLDEFSDNPVAVPGCLVALGVSGRCTLVTGIENLCIEANVSTIFFPGTSLLAKDRTSDFKVRLWEVTADIYNTVAPIIPPTLEHYLMNIPAYKHGLDDLSLKYVMTSMDMAELLYREAALPSSSVRIKNFVASYLLYLFDYISPYLEQILDKSTGQEKLYRRFISDVYQFCGTEHNLSFYSSRLCISPRLLSLIVAKYGNGNTPKQLLNKQLLFKIKTLLSSTDLTVSEIAYNLNFPDQSYLSRFFKRYEGYYPSEYRLLKKH